jgi:hypothetical protein
MPADQELLEQMINVRVVIAKNDDGSYRKFDDGSLVKHTEVWFQSYQETEEDAIASVLRSLFVVLNANINMDVAACVHEWELMPGERSSIGCGHVGPEAEVPADPFAVVVVTDILKEDPHIQ